MKQIILVISLCFLRVAFAQEITLEVSYYDGLGTKMRQESVYKMIEGKKTKIAQQIFVDSTNELREYGLVDDKWNLVSYSPETISADQKAIIEGYFYAAKSGGAAGAPNDAAKEDPNSATQEAPKKNVIQTGKFKTETCKWVSDMPRRLIFGPGCSTDRKAMLCVGYVVCETDDASGAKFIRQSTCGSENCSEANAVACTKQASYGSCQPANNDKTISDKVINATTIED